MATLTWEEKIEKAKETASKKAAKDGLDEQATQALIDEAVEKVMKAKEEAETKVAQKTQAVQTESKKNYIVKVKDNPSFCGIGAGGVQFANGEAHITSKRMAEWFGEHNGYEVTEA